MQAIKTKFKKATATPRGRIITLVILLVFLSAIASGIWYWNANKKAIIRNKLEDGILEKSKGLYKIKYDNMELDEIAGSLSVSNLSLAYDSIKYIELEKQEKAPPVLFNIYIPEINVTGVKTPRALIENEIAGNKLEIKRPVIDIIYTHSGKDSLLIAPTKELYDQILGNLNLIKMDSVLITGAQINALNRKTGKTNIQFMNISITLVDVQVDSTGNADITRLIFAKEIDMNCEKLAWSSPNRLYNYIADSISLNSLSRDLRIKSFRIDPTLNEAAFVKALPTQDDRFDFSINNIYTKNINLKELFYEKIVADSMLIHSASFKIYRDLAIPRDKKNRVGSYPHQVIEKIPVSFRIGKLSLSRGFVEYKERNHITRQSGKVQFYNLYAAISNFTNDKKAIAANNIMTANVSSLFLNKTPLKVSWVFYLLHPKGRFDVKGTLGAINAEELNPLTEPMGPARIKEGHIQRLEFDLSGDDYGMDGHVKFLYDDLKVAILEKDKGSKELDEKLLTSFVANIMIKNSNPKRNEDVRTIQVHNDRDKNRSIFHVTWKTVFKGVKETAGINK
jgi:hypothetical protein